jgi:hypothetical protein
MNRWIYGLIVTGILVAAGYNFLRDYNGMRTRSVRRPSHSPTSLLTGMYIAEKAFHSEHGTYDPALNAVGFAPQSSFPHIVGMPKKCIPPNHRGPEKVYSKIDAPIYDSHQYSLANPQTVRSSGRDSKTLAAIQKYLESGFDGPCKDLKSGFVALAVGNIDSDDTLDVWSIDESKSVVHVVDDAQN